jgi:hypothetical protein
MLERVEGIEIGFFGLAEADSRRGLTGDGHAHVRPSGNSGEILRTKVCFRYSWQEREEVRPALNLPDRCCDQCMFGRTGRPGS